MKVFAWLACHLGVHAWYYVGPDVRGAKGVRICATCPAKEIWPQ